LYRGCIDSGTDQTIPTVDDVHTTQSISLWLSVLQSEQNYIGWYRQAECGEVDTVGIIPSVPTINVDIYVFFKGDKLLMSIA